MTTAAIVIIASLLHAMFQAGGDVIRHRDLARLTASARGRRMRPWRSRGFRIGVYLVCVGFCFQVLALHYGRVVSVQTIAVSALVFVLLFATLFSDHSLEREDWAGTALVMAGIIVFLLTVHPTDGVDKETTINSFGWMVAMMGVMALALLAIMISPSLEPTLAALVLGGVAGVAVGVGAGMIAACGIIFRTDGIGGLLSHWILYALMLVEGLRLFTIVRGLQFGPVTTSVGAFVVMSPVTSWVVGVFLLSEPFATGAAFWIGVSVTTGLLLPGVLVLVRSRTLRETYSLKGMTFQASW